MILKSTQAYIPEKLYYTQKLEPKTVQKVLGASTFTIDRLFSIAFGEITKIDLFEELDHEFFKLRFYVKLHMAFAGDARRQVSNIKNWRKLILRRPKYELRVILLDKFERNHYTFEHSYTNIDRLYEDIDLQKLIVEQFIAKWDETVSK